MLVRGKVRDLGKPYADGVRRREIHVPLVQATGLPYALGRRVPITLIIGNQEYGAGLRSTVKNAYAWVCPDLDRSGEKIRLADVLRAVDLDRNVALDMKIDGSRIVVTKALT